MWGFVGNFLRKNEQETNISLDAATMVNETLTTQAQTQNVNETLHDSANVQLNRTQTSQSNASPQGED